jgi:hypothetical protein
MEKAWPPQGIDLSFFDIESEGREHTADRCEFREVIIGDDADFDRPARLSSTDNSQGWSGVTG